MIRAAQNRDYRAILVSAAILSAFPISAQNPTGKTDSAAWKKVEFLLGKWTGIADEKETQLGAGQGVFSFDAELNQKIMVRRNHAEYASGVRHDDLMVIYFDAPNEAPRAIYFDTEGHVIHYNLTFPSAGAVTFESDPGQPGPRYRLSYWLEGGSLKGKFESAPPGAGYKTYMSWASRKN
jgi:hypothetical protein